MIRAISKYWWTFTLRGVIAIAFGLAAVLWPTLTLGVMVLLFGLFALFEGGLTIVTSFKKGEEKGGWTLLLEGLVGLLVCVIVLLGSSIGSMLWPRVAAVMLVYYIAGWAILAGLFKIITAFRIRREVKGEWMLGLSGLISILVGLILILRPGAGVLAVAWLIGIFAIILGIFQLLLGLKFRKIGTGSKN
ncbi:MAG TPA: HdeD family acid-resistance protein [Thermodesulfobacteriota bacterium]|nr:HdeD family acid-resistance protein [Thermodesulfobacteriota bacterium]